MKRKFPNTRLRRIRANSPIRNLIRENTLSPHDVIQPIFLIEGKNKIQKIKSMPDISRISIDNAIKEIKVLKKLGIQGVALFPCIDNKYKDKQGTESHNPNGLMQQAIKNIKDWINVPGAFKEFLFEILIISLLVLFVWGLAKFII